MTRFEGKRIVVAAGCSGIGAATSERLASTNALIARGVDAFDGIDGLANVGADLSPETMAGDQDVLDMNVDIWLRTINGGSHFHN